MFIISRWAQTLKFMISFYKASKLASRIHLLTMASSKQLLSPGTSPQSNKFDQNLIMNGKIKSLFSILTRQHWSGINDYLWDIIWNKMYTKTYQLQTVFLVKSILHPILQLKSWNLTKIAFCFQTQSHLNRLRIIKDDLNSSLSRLSGQNFKMFTKKSLTDFRKG